jgi:hypothetical protein
MSADRKAILEAAVACVTVDRAATHGEAEKSFAAIAAYWSIWLGPNLNAPLAAQDVSALMVLLKMARAAQNPQHLDNWIDLCGYGAIAGELAVKS